MYSFHIYRVKLKHECGYWHAFGAEWEEGMPYDFLMGKLIKLL